MGEAPAHLRLTRAENGDRLSSNEDRIAAFKPTQSAFAAALFRPQPVCLLERRCICLISLGADSLSFIKWLHMILECKKCQALVNAEYIAQYDYSMDGEEYGVSGIIPGRVVMWKCPNCERPLLTDDDDLFGQFVLYPPEDNRVNPGLPVPLKSAYSEAIACFKSKAYTATVIMCRKTLEGICVEHGVKGNNLVSSLKELKDKGVIENRLYEWADALRISGNEATHDVTVIVSSEDARDILEFTNALLEYVFTFRDKFEEFKKRRAAKNLPKENAVPF